MCTDGVKSLEIKMPKSRHVVTVGKMLPLIHSGLHSESLICRVQHLLTEMGSCHISAQSAVVKHVAEVQHHIYQQL